MKKKALFFLPLLALFGVLAFAIKPVSYSPAYAEGNEVSEVVPSQEGISTSEEATSEEVTKWKELYDQAMKKLEEAKKIEFLGTTLGAVLGAAITLGLAWLSNKLNRNIIHDLQDFGRNALDTGKTFFDKGQECLDKGNECLGKANTLIDKVDDYVKASDKQKEAFEKQIAEERAAHKEEINALLAIVSNDPGLVASGTAEKINKLFRKD